jgi:hypothetical protein
MVLLLPSAGGAAKDGADGSTVPLPLRRWRLHAGLLQESTQAGIFDAEAGIVVAEPLIARHDLVDLWSGGTRTALPECTFPVILAVQLLTIESTWPQILPFP